jgi:hypothetical protein
VIARRIVVAGRVQGVGFRDAMCTSAQIHRVRNCIHNLRYQRHGCCFSNMSAAFQTLCDNGVSSDTFYTNCKGDRCYHRNDLDAVFLQFRNKLAGITRTCSHNRNAFFTEDIHDRIRMRIQEHHIDAKGFIGQFFRFAESRAPCRG